MHIDLKKIIFDDSFISNDKIIKEECPIVDGEIFVKGACDIFAYALRSRFDNYILFKASNKDGPGVHYYCTKNCAFIDAHGVFDTLDELLSKVNSFNFKNFEIEKINDYIPDFSFEWTQTLLNFANEIITYYDYLYYVE